MSQQEYTIHIFGQDLTSQDGLFRLDEIRRVGIQIGKVEDTEKTMVRTQSRALSSSLKRSLRSYVSVAVSGDFNNGYD